VRNDARFSQFLFACLLFLSVWVVKQQSMCV
jgi:hypothetical protein